MTIWAFVGQALLGWLFADLIGGIAHFIEDRQLLPAFLDRHIGLPNRLHHLDPQGVTRDANVLRRNWTTIAAALPVIAVCYLLAGASVFLGFAAVGGLLSYEAHRWAHAPRLAPRWVAVLQEIGALQSPKQHALHHRPPHGRGFCILTDWLNPVLDALGFWRLLGLTKES